MARRKPRRRRPDRFEVLALEARNAAIAAAESAQASRSASADLVSALESLSRQIDEHKRRDERTTMERVVLLWGSVFLLLLLGTGTTYFGTLTFIEPAAPITDENWITVLGDVTEASLSTQVSPMRASVAVQVQGPSRAIYSFWMPKNELHRHVYVVLAGKAMLSGISTGGNASIPEPEIATSTHQCQVSASFSLACQIVSVDFNESFVSALSGVGGGRVRYASDCLEDYYRVDGMNNPNANQYFVFNLVGDPSWAVTKIDPFHTQYSIPRATGYLLDERSTSFLGISFQRRIAAFPLDKTCQEASVGRDEEAESFSIEPEKGLEQGSLTWPFDPAQDLNFITRTRNGDRVGNICLAAAGALAGLAIGILPFAWEATAKRRRQKNFIQPKQIG